MTTRVVLCPILPLSLCSLCRLCPVLSSSPLLWLPLLQRRPRRIHRPPGGCCSPRMNGGHGRSTSPAPAVDADHGNCVIGLTNSGPGMQWEWTGKSASLLRTQARAPLLTPQGVFGCRRDRGRLPALGGLRGRRQRQCRCASPLRFFSPRLRATQPRAQLTRWVAAGRPAAARIGHSNNDHWDDGPASDPGHYFICERYP